MEKPSSMDAAIAALDTLEKKRWSRWLVRRRSRKRIVTTCSPSKRKSNKRDVKQIEGLRLLGRQRFNRCSLSRLSSFVEHSACRPGESPEQASGSTVQGCSFGTTCKVPNASRYGKR